MAYEEVTAVQTFDDDISDQQQQRKESQTRLKARWLREQRARDGLSPKPLLPSASHGM